MRVGSPRWNRTFIASAVVLAILFFTLPLTLPGSLRTRLTRALGERFGGSVEVQSLRISVLPRLRVAGEGVVVRRQSGTHLPPLISIRSFSGEAGLFGLLGSKLHVRQVRLVGLEINIPPGGVDIGGDKDRLTSGAARAPAAGSAGKRPTSRVVVDDLVSEDAMLRILRDAPDKKPREFRIGRLSMQDTGGETPWAFTASLTNPTPPGLIETHGTFGPWNADSPARTPLAADYTFREADLGVFKGIRGILQSSGSFSGVLERIEIDGQADVPDFALNSAGHSVPLRTTFHSIVDGTNGNTWLRPVDGTFRETAVHAEGGVIEHEGEDGRTVSLDVTMDRARIEDVLLLAVEADQPAMSGALTVRARLELPPGRADALQKLALNGTFTIAEARFTRGGIQARMNELSQKAQGEKGDPEQIVSDFTGRFAMGGGVIRFSTINFSMPGAQVTLNGTFAAATQAMDFKGTVRLDAKLSELTTGMKSMFLKVIGPVFRRKGMTIVPITIGGTAKDPKVGLDIGRAFTPK